MGFNLGNISIGMWTGPGVLGIPAFHHNPVFKRSYPAAFRVLAVSFL
jgi:hypothetical protein